MNSEAHDELMTIYDHRFPDATKWQRGLYGYSVRSVLNDLDRAEFDLTRRKMKSVLPDLIERHRHAVDSMNFELAAQLRDEIAAFRGGIP